MPNITKPITWVKPPAKFEGEVPRIKTVSYSRLTIYEQCRRRAALAFLLKEAAPSRKGESAGDRGSRHHTYIQDYILHKTDELNSEVLHHREGAIQTYRELYAKNPEAVEVERRWNFDTNWNRCEDNDWDSIWYIVKIDALAFISQDEIHLTDWKTGKKSGKEIPHMDQLFSYAISAFMRFPNVEKVTAELVYTDAGETTSMVMTRDEIHLHFERLNKRLSRVTDAVVFPADPSIYHCRFCDYKTGKITKDVDGTALCNLNPV